MKPAVLFVCLGNICRSPLAEAAFRREAAARGLDVEVNSAGTGDWHIGHAPDPRAQAVALANGIDIGHYRARQVTPDDFRRFTRIVALDSHNLTDLEAIRPHDAVAHVSMLLDCVEGRTGQAVPDPYYGGAEGFDDTWVLVTQAARALVQRIAVDDRID